MENSTTGHCRFCAEPKSTDKMLDILDDGCKYEDVSKKLDFLNAFYVNVGTDSTLPRTVCFVCYDALNKAYDFLEKVKRAQTILKRMYIPSEQLSNDEREDYVVSSHVHDGMDLIKFEVPIVNEVDTENAEFNLNIKVRNKDRIKEEPEDINVNRDNQNNDVLDAAMCHATPEMTLYAKDIKTKKSISSWKEYPWICCHCDIEFLDIVTLRLHSKQTHGKCCAFLCVDCDNLGNNDFDSFVKHIRIHWTKLRKRCHYCDESIPEDSMPLHIEQHFLKNQVPCSKCGEILKNNEFLQKHLSEYSPTEPVKKPRRKPGTPLTLEELTCGLCKKVYKNPYSLRDHLKVHTNDRKRNYTCDSCGKTFYKKGTLTAHIMTHNKVRPHKCRICNKSFLLLNKLRRHVEMHSGIKPFSCEECGRCFRLQCQLKAHKIIHTDSMPHVCQYCNKAFKFKSILKNHEQQHTGAKPYSCQECSMQFTNWSNYNKHMKRRHGMDTSKKKRTPEGVFPINPQTGELVLFSDAGTEEWKTRIMVPGKRGKKKTIKLDAPLETKMETIQPTDDNNAI